MGRRLEKWWGEYCLWRMDCWDEHAQQALGVKDEIGARQCRARAVAWGQRALRAGQQPLSPAKRRARLGA